MNWQNLVKENVTTAEELRDLLSLSQQEYESICAEIEIFPMSVSRYYLSLIDPDDPNDPIRKMAVPSGSIDLSDGELDTSGEHDNSRMPGLQHKYTQTALVLTTQECAMFCRHCFRRRLVGKKSDEIAADMDRIVEYILENPGISNVLLSGGDSFMLPTGRIHQWLDRFSSLDQLDFIRFGTRTPVTFPQRILSDPELPEVLGYYAKKKQIYVVTHFNHPHEITPTSTEAIKTLQNAGIVVKNQTVLMKGINDDPQVLGELLKQVTALGIIQHYIFQCRPALGVKTRFQVPLVQGCDIVQKALAMQNGLGKSADYTMSHVTGKIRILGKTDDGQLLLQYKQAKDPAMIGKIFTLQADDSRTWL